MTQAGRSQAIPAYMSRPCARFFAADWEAMSFLEFFVDLQLRVSEDSSDGAGRTLTRLSDHARFALQLTLLRSVDSFVAYVAELALLVTSRRQASPWRDVVSDENELHAGGGMFREPRHSAVPVDVSLQYATTLAYGNVRQLDRLFESATDIPLFMGLGELERVSRLSSLRNLIAHGRIFAAEDLAVLVDETASVRDLKLNLKAFREDLDFLRVVVARADDAAAVAWRIERPVTSEQIFEAIGRVATSSNVYKASTTADPVDA
jgi:hypothetical protein